MWPRDGYDWQVFLDDQASAPLIYHGTSTLYEKSIRSRGLVPGPGLSPEIEAALERCADIAPYPEALRTLRAIRGSEGRGPSGVHVTSDWAYACHYSAMRGGEPAELALSTLEEKVAQVQTWPGRPPGWDIVESARLALSKQVAGHKPVVVAIRFDRIELRAQSRFFCERAFFEDERAKLIANGTRTYEYRHMVPSVEPERIVTWVRLT